MACVIIVLEMNERNKNKECGFPRLRDYPGCFEDCPDPDRCPNGGSQTKRVPLEFAPDLGQKELYGELTPEEAKELMYCWIHESQNRYGKVNREAPLYLKLKRIAEPVLLKLRPQEE